MHPDFETASQAHMFMRTKYTRVCMSKRPLQHHVNCYSYDGILRSDFHMNCYSCNAISMDT